MIIGMQTSEREVAAARAVSQLLGEVERDVVLLAAHALLPYVRALRALREGVELFNAAVVAEDFGAAEVESDALALVPEYERVAVHGPEPGQFEYVYADGDASTDDLASNLRLCVEMVESRAALEPVSRAVQAGLLTRLRAVLVYAEVER